LPTNINNILTNSLYIFDMHEPKWNGTKMDKCFRDHRKRELYTMEVCHCCQMNYAKTKMHCHVYCNKCIKNDSLQCRECIAELNSFGSYEHTKCEICFSVFQNGCRLCGSEITPYGDLHPCRDKIIEIKICGKCWPMHFNKFRVVTND